MKKTLLSIGLFIATFFGMFVILNMLVVIIFPVTWNEVVTCGPWIAVYTFFGLFLAVAVTDSFINNH